jgi:phosphoribosylanthranilate isomerase
VFVKICGITRVEDARAALAEGATALGFVFWPKSPRYIDPDRARAIVAALPAPVMTVGVFVNQPADEVNRVAEHVGLNAVQLHGDEAPGFAEAMNRPVMKALSLSNGSREAERWPVDVTLLIDAHDVDQRGGTGKKADWAAAAALSGRRRIVLAGGLTPENVREAIAAVKPFGIDVSSGVESAPGIKDENKLAALFEAVAE